MNTRKVARICPFRFFFPSLYLAQVQGVVVPLKPGPAPLYWQPAQMESQMFAAAKPDAFSADANVNATTPANSLVFVGMTPCRVVDAGSGSGFTDAFGPPSLVGGATGGPSPFSPAPRALTASSASSRRKWKRIFRRWSRRTTKGTSKSTTANCPT